jgi:hypothetical protein
MESAFKYIKLNYLIGNLVALKAEQLVDCWFALKDGVDG